jgi:hypothetical protein
MVCRPARSLRQRNVRNPALCDKEDASHRNWLARVAAGHTADDREKVLLIQSMGLIFFSMIEKLHIQRDWATVLAFVFGAAVIVPSIVAMLLSLGAVARLLF